MRFEKSMEILNTRENVWQFLWDIDRFMTCLPGCKEVATVEEGKHYKAKMIEKVGPFRVEFPLRIEIIQSEEMSYIKARASGSDNRLASHMKVDLEVHLKEDGEKTQFSFVASVDMLGKLAALGQSIFKRKANHVLMPNSRSGEASGCVRRPPT